MSDRSRPDPHHPTAVVETDDAREAGELSAGENADLCSGCVKCCTYITIEIDSPRSPREYDQWIWALHHRNIQLYVEKPERWFVHVDAVCEQLGENGRCKIYGRHPVLCREYDPRSCERRLPLADIVAWFENAEQFEDWIRAKRPKHWERLLQFRRGPDPPAPGKPAGRPENAGLVALTGLSGSPLVGSATSEGNGVTLSAKSGGKRGHRSLSSGG